MRNQGIAVLAFGVLVGSAFVVALDASLWERLEAASFIINIHELPPKQLVVMLGFDIIIWIFLVVMFVWFVCAWGAYRAIYRLSRLRSVAAFMIALLFEVQVLLGIMIVAYGLNIEFQRLH